MDASNIDKERQFLRSPIQFNRRNSKRNTDILEFYDIETVRQSTDWSSYFISIIIMLSLMIFEIISSITLSLLFPPLSILLLSFTEFIRGRKHSVFQLLPWSHDAIRAEIYFGWKDFTDWNTFVASAIKTIIATSIFCLLGYVPGILLAFHLWTSFFLVRAKIWWRQFFFNRQKNKK